MFTLIFRTILARRKFVILTFSVVWVTCLFFQTSYAQGNVIGLPVQWGQYTQAFPLINPASIGLDGKLEINIGNQRHLGLWKNNQTYYANANYRIYNRKEKATNFHTIGAIFIGDKEGQYLDRTRFYAVYAYHLQLNEKLKVSAGASIGLMNYFVSGNDFNAGGSATTPDANVGIWIYGPDYYIGISTNQIFEGTLTPIRETTQLIRHWNFTIGKTFAIGPSFDLKPSVLTRVVPNMKPDIDLCLMGVINELVAVGANYRHQKEIVFMFGLDNLKWSSSAVKAMLSYNVPFSNYTASNMQTMELTFRYIFAGKQKEEQTQKTEDE